MKAVVFGTLTEEDLTRWRQACGQFQALEMNPRAYSAQETEGILMRYYRIFGEINKEYDIPKGTLISVAPTTGQIFEDTSHD